MTTFRPFENVATAPRRLPEAGRIRLGQQVSTRNGKTRPAALHTLRFTSPQPSLIHALAAVYGGTAKPWRNGNLDEWEVVTDAREVPVVLPPDPLGETPIYELWAGGSLQRRCDGEEVTCPKRVSDDEVAMEVSACICNRTQQAACKPTTRLAVILPNVPFGGVWRLDTHSWNAADELPGMVGAIQAFSSRGFVRAFLGVRDEEKMEAGKKKQFIVPYLRMDTSVQEALDGAAGLTAIPAAPLAALPAGRREGAGGARSEVGTPTADPSQVGGSTPQPSTVPLRVDNAPEKNELLKACGGDRAMARMLWGDRESITRQELDDLIESALPPCEAELVDESGKPF